MLSQARVRPEAGVLPSVSCRGLVVGPHGVFHNEESIRVTSYRAVRAVAMTPSRSAGERPRGPLPGAGPRRAAPAAQRRPTVVALSSLGLAAAVVAGVGVVGLGAATSVAAVPRPDAVGALPVAELRGVQTSRGETRVTRQGDAMLPEGPAVGDARAARKAVAERQAELEATAEAIDRETQRLSDVAAQQRQLAAREAAREAERAKAAEAASKAFVWRSRHEKWSCQRAAACPRRRPGDMGGPRRRPGRGAGGGPPTTAPTLRRAQDLGGGDSRTAEPAGPVESVAEP